VPLRSRRPRPRPGAAGSPIASVGGRRPTAGGRWALGGPRSTRRGQARAALPEWRRAPWALPVEPRPSWTEAPPARERPRSGAGSADRRHTGRPSLAAGRAGAQKGAGRPGATAAPGRPPHTASLAWSVRVVRSGAALGLYGR